MQHMTQESPAESPRQELRNCRRIVLKFGTRILVGPTGRPDPRRLRALVADAAAAHREGREILIVSSGAIGAGMEALGLKKRPHSVPDLQMAAAVGQSRLMSQYDRLFAAEGLRVGQVLLTHDGLKMRERHLNARHTLLNLVRHGTVPIINENDAVAVDEIRFGDNDLLAALVAMLVDADLLVLLTTVNGLQTRGTGGRGRRLPWLRAVTERELALAFGKGSELSTGGMASKLRAAQQVVDAGAAVVIADGRRKGILRAVLSGEDVGTLIGRPGRTARMAHRRRWIAFFHRAEGALIVDEGARAALERQGGSLLPIGIREVEGQFKAGAVVNLRGPDGVVFARGLVNYGADDLRRLQGKKTAEIRAMLGSAGVYEEAVHRDHMVLLGHRQEKRS